MRPHHVLNPPRSVGLRAVVAVLLVGGLFGMHGLAGHDGGVAAVASATRGTSSHMDPASPMTSQGRPMAGHAAPGHAPAGHAAHTMEGPAPSGHPDHAPHPMVMGLCLAVLTLGLVLLLLLIRPGSTLVALRRRVVRKTRRPSSRPDRPPPSLHALSVLRC